MIVTNNANKAVNCPTHGTHGNLSNGRCWYCVQAGITVAPTPSTRIIGASSQARIPGTVRTIK